jgi:hypothetical protein
MCVCVCVCVCVLSLCLPLFLQAQTFINLESTSFVSEDLRFLFHVSLLRHILANEMLFSERRMLYCNMPFLILLQLLLSRDFALINRFLPGCHIVNVYFFTFAC